jgi:Type IV secretion system pilin
MASHISNKHGIVLIALFSLAMASPLMGFAQVPTQTGQGGTINTQTGQTGTYDGGAVVSLKNPLSGVNSVSDIVLKFMQIVSYLAVIFGVIMIMWVGLQLVLAQGKPEEIKKRSGELLWVVVGIGVILGARVLVSVVINTLQSTGAVNSSIIQNAKTALNSQ